MPTDIYRDTGADRSITGRRRTVPRQAGPTRSRLSRRNPLAVVILLLFVVFFVLPVLWLLLAATKTDGQLVHGNPLSFGSWHALRANWDALTGYQDDTIMLWLRNSAVYSFLALVITLVVAIPAGYAFALTE